MEQPTEIETLGAELLEARIAWHATGLALTYLAGGAQWSDDEIAALVRQFEAAVRRNGLPAGDAAEFNRGGGEDKP